jgi:hypothetical protein
VAGLLSPDIGGSEKPRSDRHAVASRAKRVARSIEAFVVAADVCG